VKTKIYTKMTARGKRVLAKESEPFVQEFTAEWKFITVDLWQKVEPGRKTNPIEVEKNAWKYLLQKTSLFPVTQENDELTKESLEKLWEITPGAIAKELVRPVVESAYLSKVEVERINRECTILFLAEGKVNDPHPLIEEAIDAIAFKERYGIPIHPSRNAMPQRTYVGLKIISNLYAESMSQKNDAERLRREAMKKAGITR